jgi:hypothetical protein
VEPGSRARANVAFAIAFAVFAALLVRLYDVQVAGHSAYAAQSDRQSRGQRTERAGRGPIRDATGEVLAVSVPRPSIGVDPTILTEPASVAALSRILGRDAAALMARTREDGRPVRFAWLKRFATDDEAAAVQALKLKGVTIVTEFDRQYGRGRLLAHVLGITGSEDEGGEGLERRYDRLLRGGQSTADLEVDGRRRPVEPWDAPDAGGTLRLTIDARFQKIVEEEIDAAVAEFRPKWAAAVALDPRTGDVLAMTCRPGFDPAAPAPPGLSAKAAADARRNRVLTDPYEPGSTFKPFIVAWAIEKGLLTSASKYDCEMGSWTFGPRTLHDHHAYGVLTVTEIVAHSSNIGAVKIGATVLGKQRLHDAVKAFGFGEPTGIDLPAEENGVVHPLSKWSVYSITSIPMGHEIAVTPLQLAAAMGVFASGGQRASRDSVRAEGALGEDLRADEGDPRGGHDVGHGQGDQGRGGEPRGQDGDDAEARPPREQDRLHQLVRGLRAGGVVADRAGGGDRRAAGGVLRVGRGGAGLREDPEEGLGLRELGARARGAWERRDAGRGESGFDGLRGGRSPRERGTWRRDIAVTRRFIHSGTSTTTPSRCGTPGRKRGMSCRSGSRNSSTA